MNEVKLKSLNTRFKLVFSVLDDGTNFGRKKTVSWNDCGCIWVDTVWKELAAGPSVSGIWPGEIPEVPFFGEIPSVVSEFSLTDIFRTVCIVTGCNHNCPMRTPSYHRFTSFSLACLSANRHTKHNLCDYIQISNSHS